MNGVLIKNDSKKLFQEQKIQEILALLTKSMPGLTAMQVSEQIKIKDVRLVRLFVRQALSMAEKSGLRTQRVQIQGKATKIYKVLPK